MRKIIYLSERILNILELEKEIQNIELYFNILKKELKKTTSSSETIDAAVYQIGLSLKKAKEFKFLIEKRKYHLPKALSKCDEDIHTFEKKYINQEDSQVTVSFELPGRDWCELSELPAWREVENYLYWRNKTKTGERQERW